MKKLTVFLIILLAGCQTEQGKKFHAEAIAAQRRADSMRKITDHYTNCIDMQIKLLSAGATKEEAAIQVDEIRPDCHCQDSLVAQAKRKPYEDSVERVRKKAGKKKEDSLKRILNSK